MQRRQAVFSGSKIGNKGGGYVVIALGSNVHIFARPHRRAELAECFERILGSPVRTVEFPGIGQPMLVVSFPAGGI